VAARADETKKAFERSGAALVHASWEATDVVPRRGFPAYLSRSPRDILKALQQPTKKAFGCFGTPPWLNEDIEHDAVLVHDTPKNVPHSPNPDEYLGEVSLIPGLWPTAARAFGKARAELFAPAPNGSIGDDDAVSPRDLTVRPRRPS
jgi:hypothetical protein